MNLLGRFNWYFLGLCMGCLVVFGIFSDRYFSCSYFPNSRVLKNINSKKIKYTETSKKLLIKLNIDTTKINQILKKGIVNFNKSNTKLDNCKIYQIEYNKYFINIKNCDSIAYIKNIEKL